MNDGSTMSSMNEAPNTQTQNPYAPEPTPIELVKEKAWAEGDEAGRRDYATQDNPYRR